MPRAAFDAERALRQQAATAPRLLAPAANELRAALDAAEKERESDYQRFIETSAAVMDRAVRAERERDELRALLAFVDDRLIRAQALAEQVAALEKALRPKPYRGCANIICRACDGIGDVNGRNSDDPRWVKCTHCDGTGLGQELREALSGSPPPVAPLPAHDRHQEDDDVAILHDPWYEDDGA